MANGILNRRQKEALRKAVAENFVDLHNFVESEEQLVKELLANGTFGSRALIAIIERAIRMPEGTYISWVEGDYRTTYSTTSKGKKQQPKEELVDLIFHCGRIGDSVGLAIKFRRTPKEIFELINSTAIHYSIVVEKRVEYNKVDYIF